MSVQSILRTCGSSDMNQRKISSARLSGVSAGGILPRLRQNSFLSRACKFLIRFLVVSAKSSELTSGSLRKPGDIKLIKSVQAAPIARRDGKGAEGSQQIFDAC